MLPAATYSERQVLRRHAAHMGRMTLTTTPVSTSANHRAYCKLRFASEAEAARGERRRAPRACVDGVRTC
jgi:hypothetical protein